MAKPGLCTITCKDKSIFQTIDIAKQIGAEGIEIWAKPPHIQYPLNKNELLKIKDYALLKKIEICALGSYFNAGCDVYINETKITFDQMIQGAELLGTNLIRIWAGEKNYEDYSEEEIDNIIENINHTAKTAQKSSITIVIERHSKTITNQWDNIKDIFNRIKSDNVFLNYQIPRPASKQDYELKSIADYSSLLSISRHAHLQNYSVNDINKRTFLDSGIIDYSQLTRVIKETNYPGYFMIEHPEEMDNNLDLKESLKRDIDFIRGL